MNRAISLLIPGSLCSGLSLRMHMAITLGLVAHNI